MPAAGCNNLPKLPLRHARSPMDSKEDGAVDGTFVGAAAEPAAALAVARDQPPDSKEVVYPDAVVRVTQHRVRSIPSSCTLTRAMRGPKVPSRQQACDRAAKITAPWPQVISSAATGGRGDDDRARLSRSFATVEDSETAPGADYLQGEVLSLTAPGGQQGGPLQCSLLSLVTACHGSSQLVLTVRTCPPQTTPLRPLHAPASAAAAEGLPPGSSARWSLSPPWSPSPRCWCSWGPVAAAAARTASSVP